MNKHVIVSNKQSRTENNPVVVVNATKHYEHYEYEYQLLKLWAELIASKVSKVIE